VRKSDGWHVGFLHFRDNDWSGSHAKAGRRGKEAKKMDDLTKMVRDYVVREYLEEGDDREVTETTPLISGGIVDSFSMVSLKRFLEKKCGIQIPDADATPVAFDSVQSIVALVRRFQKQ
jgi:acyl carrier protein